MNDVEETRGDLVRERLFRSPGKAAAHWRNTEQRNRLQPSMAFRRPKKVRHVQHARSVTRPCIDLTDTICIRIGQRPIEHRVGKREDRGCRTNADGQGQDDARREAGTAP